nr:sensor histidine kinase [uncultured Anaerostipes sp.]
MDIKNKNLYYIKILMSIINLIILVFLSAVFMITLNKINNNFEARNFLENINYLPQEPIAATVMIFISFFLLLYIIEIRRKQRRKQQLSVVLYGAEIILCLIIIKFLYVNYNGIILLVIADIVTDIKDKHTRGLFLVIMGMMYMFSDYDIISMFVDIISFQQFLSVYPSQISMMIQGTRNILVAVNVIAFTAYMIILMRNQMKENARIGHLNLQLQTANMRLKEMNEQLQDYAEMSEKMAETRERNRIAREIHDTLGHTMTGLSAGIDACIAMIDFSVDATKEQLNKISQVARQGIKDIRRSVNKLRPDALEHSGLREALEKMIEETMQVSDVKIDYECQVDTLKFNQDEEDMIYRVVQESITNAIRHGEAKYIEVRLWKENKWLNLVIKDNGIGCEEIHTGFGLIHIEERIKMLQGTVEYDGSDGFKVTARIPIRWGEKR